MKATWFPRISALLVGAVVALVGMATASAQEAGGPTTDEVGSGVTSFGVGDWFNLGLRLALVIAVIWGAVHAMRWYVRRMNHGGSRNGLRALEVLETHALGPNRTLHLVRLGDRAVLVGATQERITQLLTVDDPEEFKRLTGTPEDDESTSRSDTPRTAPAMSILSALRTGLVAMRSRQAEMNARIRAQREAKTAGIAPSSPRRTRRASSPVPTTRAEEAPAREATPRFGALKGILARGERPARSVRPARPKAVANAEPAEERHSLFDRTLASIDAVDLAPAASTAAGARARASYGASRVVAPAVQSGAERSRDAAIAELQRAIEQARKTAS